MVLSINRSCLYFYVILAILVSAVSLSAGTVRVATMNSYNYLVSNRRVEGAYRYDYPKPEVEKAALRRAIRAINADIVVLQEIGGESFLKELLHDLQMEGLEYEFSALSSGVDEVRFVAVISHLPFARVNQVADLDFSYFGSREKVKRGLLEIVFGEGSKEWTLYAVHLKSNLTVRKDDPNSVKRRIGEAKAIRDYILTVHPDPEVARFLVAGDFNDTKDSSALRRFFKRGKTRITVPIDAMDSRGERWTYHYARADTYSRVDYILASAGMEAFLVDGSATVFDGLEAIDASDHRFVFADFEIE